LPSSNIISNSDIIGDDPVVGRCLPHVKLCFDVDAVAFKLAEPVREGKENGS